jgi:dihydrofolate reductase
MRKITASMFVSLDGIIEAPQKWNSPYWNEEIARFKQAELFSHDALLLGRETYEGFASAWPGRKDEQGYADRMNSMPKHVVSMTMQNPVWNNSSVIRRNVVEEIEKLKARDGQDILVFGSATLVQTLMQAELVDRFHLLVYPVVLINGIRLFQKDSNACLKLIESASFQTGVLKLVYVPVLDAE